MTLGEHLKEREARASSENRGTNAFLWILGVVLAVGLPLLVLLGWGTMMNAAVESGQEVDIQVPDGQDVKGFLDQPCPCAAIWVPLLPVLVGAVKGLAHLVGRL